MPERSWPKLSKGQRTGAIGQTIVTAAVQEELGWLYRPNHQENDFGIDGHMDVVGDDGAVLGRTIAAQVKTGPSHIQEESPSAFKLVGELKHLNYFLNSPVPVVVVLVNDKEKRAWWVHVSPEAVRLTQNGWSIWVPKAQLLDASSRVVLSALAGPVTDFRPIIERINTVRAASGEADLVMLVVSEKEVLNRDVSRLIRFFNMFEAAPDQLSSVQNKFILLVSGYDNDEREVYEIPEVREWFARAEHAVVGWPYYLALHPRYSTLPVFLACTSSFQVVGMDSGRRTKSLSIPPPEMAAFLARHFGWLNEFTEKHALPEEINKEVSLAFSEALFSITKFE